MKFRKSSHLFLFLIKLMFVNGRLFSPEEYEDQQSEVEIIDRQNFNRKIQRTKRGLRDYFRDHDKSNKNMTLIPKDKITTFSHPFQNDSNNVAFVYWKHSNNGVVFILTCHDANTSNFVKLSSKGCHSKSNFYRSENHGETYKKHTLHGAWIHSIYLSPIDKSLKVLTDYWNKTIYLTNDEGSSFYPKKVDFAPTFVHFHAFQKKYIAAFDNTPTGKKSLYITVNGGTTWKLVSINVLNYFWAEKGIDENDSMIYFEKESDKEIDNPVPEYSTYLYSSQYPYTANMTKMILKDLLVPFSVFVGKEFIVVQRNQNKKLYVCHNRDKKFHLMYYYRRFKDHLHHVVLSVENNEILLGILHRDSTMTLYLSDRYGRNLYLIQTDILTKPMEKHGLVPKTDFYIVKGLVGTFVINKVKEGTLISHDKGITWNKLIHDKMNDPLNQPATCRPKCDLVLHLRIDEAYYDFSAPILSKESAPGIILAQGYLGKVNDLASRMSSQQYVYISTDGGYTWKQTLNSLMGYAILDGGGLIAATPLKFTIDHRITFSLDFGNSWYQVHMTSLYTRIAAIISESSSKFLVINVFGFLQEQPLDSKAASNTWIVWHFNFTSMFILGHCAKDDYMIWKQNNKKCVLGQLVQSKRRRTEKLCISGPKFDNEMKVSSCACTYEDFTCDIGYLPQPSAKKVYECKSMGLNLTNTSDKCKQGEVYLETKGYTKRNGNKCKGGVEKQLSPITKKCHIINSPVILELISSDIETTTRTDVEFTFEQVSGFFDTEYVWDFGDGEREVYENYENAKKVKHSFQKHGIYNVTIKAKNKVASKILSISIKVIHAYYDNVFIGYEQPVVVGNNIQFTLKEYVSEGISKPIRSRKNTIYAWSFGNLQVNTGSVTKIHKFLESGRYKVNARIIDSFITRDVTELLQVFIEAVVLELTFTPKLDDYNKLTYGWLADFTTKLKNFLCIKYNIIDEHRMVLKGKLSLPTTIQVYICDTENTQNNVNSAHIIADFIENDINQNRPAILTYELRNTHITKAKKHRYIADILDASSTNKHDNVNTWIYIIVVLLIAIVTISVFSFIYFKKKGYVCSSKQDAMRQELVLHMDDQGGMIYDVNASEAE